MPQWSLPAPEGSELTAEGDEVYTRVGEHLPPSESQGWTIHCIERKSRCEATAIAGDKTSELFEQGTAKAWQWAQPAYHLLGDQCPKEPCRCP